MTNPEIEIRYKNSKIQFDSEKEEWVAYLGEDDNGQNEFKRNVSLKKLKEAVDRFSKKEFKFIPILLFGEYDGHGDMENADIISFTQTPGECWIRKSDDRREKINLSERKFSSARKIYACGNVHNEPILKKIMDLDIEIKTVEKELQQKRKKRIHLIDGLQHFDILGYAEAPQVED